MSSITKTIRLSGHCTTEDAVRTVLARAAAPSPTSRASGSSKWVERWTTRVLTLFNVTLDITFGIKDPVEHG